MSSNKFKHFVFTRFNVRSSNWEPANKKWLERRFHLFEKYCFPSFKNQNNRNFEWIVLFDKQTPEEFIHRINSYNSNLLNFRPYFIEKFSVKEIYKIIKENIKPNNAPKHIITTRVDNDDALAYNFIENIQKQYKDFSVPHIINFDKGLLYNEDTKKVYVRNHYINAFATLIEPYCENIRTIWYNKHRHLGKNFKVVLIENPSPLWLQTVHDSNISNRVKPDCHRTTRKKLEEGFQFLDLSVYNENQLSLLFNKLFTKFIYTITLLTRPLKRKLLKL
jgi:hypothetical protein